MAWSTTTIATAHGPERGVAPVLVAASRATDIPAFYAPWFVNRLRAGHVLWRNPFNGHGQYVSLTRMRCVVFWSKNPAPLLPFLPELDARGLAYYLHYTLNDYEAEGFEPVCRPWPAGWKPFAAGPTPWVRNGLSGALIPCCWPGPGGPRWRRLRRLLGKVEGLARRPGRLYPQAGVQLCGHCALPQGVDQPAPRGPALAGLHKTGNADSGPGDSADLHGLRPYTGHLRRNGGPARLGCGPQPLH